MTTANDLYSKPTDKYLPLSVLVGCYFNFIPETEIERWDLENMASPRIEIRSLMDFDFDYRRIWRLSTVWFDTKPVMILQNAGREGDDHAQRFITDAELYVEMINYLISIKPRKIIDVEDEDVIDPHEDMGSRLTTFYGNSLDGHFERYSD